MNLPSSFCQSSDFLARSIVANIVAKSRSSGLIFANAFSASPLDFFFGYAFQKTSNFCDTDSFFCIVSFVIVSFFFCATAGLLTFVDDIANSVDRTANSVD